MGVITDLIHISMTSKRSKERIIAFKAFAKIISVKLNVLEITSNRADQSFIFNFRNFIQVGFPFCFFFSISFFLSFIYGNLILCHFQVFFNFTEAKRLHEITKLSMDKAVKKTA